jgi:hypothetical protein
MRILIMEPQLDTKFIAQGLQNFAHDLVVAPTTESAIARLSEGMADLIIMSDNDQETQLNRFHSHLKVDPQLSTIPILRIRTEIRGRHKSVPCITSRALAA